MTTCLDLTHFKRGGKNNQHAAVLEFSVIMIIHLERGVFFFVCVNIIVTAQEILKKGLSLKVV